MEINGKKVTDARKGLVIEITERDAMGGKTKDPGSMIRTLAIVGASSLALVLTGCGDSAAVKQAKWQAFCTSHDFSAKQCEVLYALKENSDDANSNAGTAAALSGVAIGLSAGAGGRK